MDLGVVLAVIVVVVAVVGYFTLRRERARRARFLRRAGFGVTALLAGLFGLFVVGDTLSDPGGWRGVGLVALWAVPLVATGLLAWYRPDAAGWLLGSLVILTMGASIWVGVEPSGWRSFEDHNGPIRAVVVFSLATVLALWGLRRTTPAAVMLLAVGTVPAASAATGHGLTALAAASIAPVITGLLYAVSAYEDRHRLPPSPTASSQSERPKAA